MFIISDIANEPDDAESLVRYLLYANEFDTRGLVACTSTWMKRVVHPEDLEKIVQAYAGVVNNLNTHAHPNNQYPSGEQMLRLIKTGPSVRFISHFTRNFRVTNRLAVVWERSSGARSSSQWGC